jgi:DNA polymerase III epsilon subunit-like protein
VSQAHDNEKRFREDLPPRAATSPDKSVDAYFSADVETDGPIPGPYSILSLALVYAGRFDGTHFERPQNLELTFYRELKPISESFEPEALRVNGLDREHLLKAGQAPSRVMSDAGRWVRNIAGSSKPVLVAYPLSFDWSWLYWYFVRFADSGSPFGYSRCFDIKTAVAVKAHLPIASAGRTQLPQSLRSDRKHSHNALDDAIEQAEIFAKVFEWGGPDGEGPRNSSK